ETVGELDLRRAVLYGSAMASFCVEKFGTEKLASLDLLEIEDRFESFRELSRVDN
ncbi:MAG: sugar kinase, partial [Chlorobiaceae bacterium]|nr:sugar kinase [Chlorobiaceae bacterium]